MTYQSSVLATPGLVAYWPLNDNGGLVAADLGPNNLPLAYPSAKIDGVENVVGGGLGMAPSTTMYATRAVPVGSPLDLTAGATIAGWVTPSISTTAIIAGITNKYRIAENAGIGYGSIGWGGGVIDSRSPQTLFAVNTPVFVVGTFDGKVYRVYTNKALPMETVIPGTLPVTLPSLAGTFQVGASGGTLTGTISHVSVWNRALNAGEIRALYEQGTTVPPVAVGIKINNIYDASNATVAAAPAGAMCAQCGGTRHANEAQITPAGTADPYHPGCYGAEGGSKPILVPTAATPFAAYEGPTLRVMELVMHSLSERITGSTRATYYDGTRMQNAAAALTGQFDVYIPWTVTGAIIARHVGLPRQHWMVDMAITQIEHLWSLQEANGHIAVDTQYTGGGGSDFVTGPVGEAMLYLKPYVDATDPTIWPRWKANFLAIGTYDQTVPSAIQSESNFYINGNREIGALWGYWMMYLVSGKQQVWRDFYEQQHTYVTGLGTKVRGGVNNGTYGFVTVVADDSTQQDGRNGKGYLIERNGTAVPNGSVVGPNGDVLDGYDPNYVSLATQFLIRLYLHNPDPRLLKIINMQYNLLTDRANLTGSTATIAGISTTPWILQGAGGSRQNNTASFGVPIVPFVNVVAGRPDAATPTMLAGVFNEAVRFNTVDLFTNGTVGRDLNNLATWLMMQSTWRGDPVVS